MYSSFFCGKGVGAWDLIFSFFLKKSAEMELETWWIWEVWVTWRLNCSAVPCSEGLLKVERQERSWWLEEDGWHWNVREAQLVPFPVPVVVSIEFAELIIIFYPDQTCLVQYLDKKLPKFWRIKMHCCCLLIFVFHKSEGWHLNKADRYLDK